MNPADEIKALKEERDALKSQLVVGISEAERIAIRHQIASIDGQITGWIGRLPAPRKEKRVREERNDLTHENLQQNDPLNNVLQHYNDVIPIFARQGVKSDSAPPSVKKTHACTALCCLWKKIRGVNALCPPPSQESGC